MSENEVNGEEIAAQVEEFLATEESALETEESSDASTVAESSESEAQEEPVSELELVQQKVAELEDQLARAKAETYNVSQEYSGYVRRSKADIPGYRQAGKAEVLAALAPVFDDIYAARQHGELEGPFASIVKKLEETLGTQAEFVSYGAVGEVFDPQVHEALMAEDKEGLEEAVVGQVLQPGYRMGDRVLRPARVIVHNPA
ncbi:nucleotide exchange factor GrpE [Actinomycetaceae bacterium TAE3-ERU4]|nr:nucleotide exchange factor GrpE [Actinomycetaceae bacterium TAE3-ERU4]